jgi:hypothetical protein
MCSTRGASPCLSKRLRQTAGVCVLCVHAAVPATALPLWHTTTLAPSLTPAHRTLRHRAIFGPNVPRLQGPPFAQRIHEDLQTIQGVVFTNGVCHVVGSTSKRAPTLALTLPSRHPPCAGDLDGWAGGSLGVEPKLRPPPGFGAGAWQGTGRALHAAGSLETASAAPPQQEEERERQRRREERRGPSDEEERDEARAAAAPRLASITYAGASHCTDTHLDTWAQEGEPPEWKKQRAQAMNTAAGFARQSRRLNLAAAESEEDAAWW